MMDHLRDIARHLEEQARQDPDRCPTCGQKAQKQCPCLRRDGECPRGHQWHTCLACSVVVPAPADHGNAGCSCRTAGQQPPG